MPVFDDEERKEDCSQEMMIKEDVFLFDSLVSESYFDEYQMMSEELNKVCLVLEDYLRHAPFKLALVPFFLFFAHTYGGYSLEMQAQVSLFWIKEDPICESAFDFCRHFFLIGKITELVFFRLLCETIEVLVLNDQTETPRWFDLQRFLLHEALDLPRLQQDFRLIESHWRLLVLAVPVSATFTAVQDSILHILVSENER